MLDKIVKYAKQAKHQAVDFVFNDRTQEKRDAYEDAVILRFRTDNIQDLDVEGLVMPCYRD